LDNFINTYASIGGQSSELGKAIKIVNKMLSWRLEDTEHEEDEREVFEKRRTKIFLGYSSSISTNGTRDIIRYLAEHRMVDVMCATTGSIEEDLIKCFGDYISTEFLNNDDCLLAKTGYERQGNILIPVEI
jgi:deoxyhypusine synthase